MKNRIPLLQDVVLLMAALFLMIGIRAFAEENASPMPQAARSDLVVIDSMQKFGTLERPVVVFAHDLHTAAVAGQDRDSSVCPRTVDNRLSLLFKRTEDLPKKELMNLYHDACIGCHKENAAARQKTGPVECGACHRRNPPPSDRVPMQFDQSLHYRHSKAQDEQCGRCHHEYDKTAKKLVYVKGKEGSCRYCHVQNGKDGVMPMSTASHLACISCHLENRKQNRKTGPVDCHGCHDAASRQKYEVVADVPRYKRNQPDQVFVKKGKGAEDGRMARVAFDHQAHEAYNDTCIRCHHKDLNACSSCHTLKGDKAGRGVTLEQAMHHRSNASSCIGCHQKQQAQTECAGCHRFASIRNSKGDQYCASCHLPSFPVLSGDEDTPSTYSSRLAAGALSNRKAVNRTYEAEDIPDKVKIGTLADQYKPVEMPHRKMVYALMNGVRDDKLAGFFHPDQGTICRGCHHNSPASKTPPKCSSCHTKRAFDSQQRFRPDLLGAYHIQCMECHENMGLKKLSECTRCHAKNEPLTRTQKP